MHIKKILPLVLLMASGATLAATCEESFVKKGSPFSGTKYTSSVSLPGLTVSSAIAQMRGIALGKKYDILSEDIESGSMLFEQRQTSIARAIPVIVTASDESGIGHVEMMVKTSPGVLLKADNMKTEMCAMLNEIKIGKAGNAAAAKGKASTASSEATKIEAATLSSQLAREAKSNSAVIAPRYKGRVFTISGRVGYQRADGGVQKISFDIPDTSGFITLPNEPYFKVAIICRMAKNQTAYALSVRERERVKLTGTFFEYDDILDVFWLKDCRPE
jgi:hypothetical protein